MKHLIQNVLPTKTAKVVGTLALASMTLLTVACAPQAEDPGDVGADIEEPGEPAEVPEGMELNAAVPDDETTAVDEDAPVLPDIDVDISETDLTDLVGETVTVSTEVTETLSPNVFTVYRSEERRVGKECRSRWSPHHYKKKYSLHYNR